MQQVEDYARNRLAPNLDAASGMLHGSASANPSSAPDSEHEAYERELAEFEEKARQARKEGYAYALTPPVKPQKQRQPITPY